MWFSYIMYLDESNFREMSTIIMSTITVTLLNKYFGLVELPGVGGYTKK